MTDRVVRLEQCEMAAWFDFARAAGPALAEEVGVEVQDLDGALATTAARVDVLAFNRTLGLGVTRSATPAQLDAVIDFYKRRHVRRFFVQVCPEAIPEELPAWLEARGFRLYNHWIRLARRTSDPPHQASELAVREIGKTEARVFGRIVAAAFEWNESLERLTASAVGRPGWRHYMAYDRETPIATAAHFVHGATAWFDFAATLPSHRGRGAQKALISRRLIDAAADGCTEVTVEAAEPRSDRPALSYRNLLRAGFEEVYRRPNYLLEF